MLLETGFCHGIENYSRHIALREEGETPTCLIDFFNKDFLFITITIITQLYSIKSTSYASNTLHFSNHVFPYYVFLFHT